MGDSPSTEPSGGFAPCPRCGYDLRGHPDHTQCPECGHWVVVSASQIETTRWIDRRLLDLWSIGLLQSVGVLAGLVSLVAIRQGQYVAVGLGLASGIYTVVATLWFIGVVAGFLWRVRQPTMRHSRHTRRRSLRRMLWIDALLVAVWPVLFVVMRQWLL